MKRRTVLITGAPLTKALHFVRLMGHAGHKVIVADQDPTFYLNMSRFSKHTYKFILLSSQKSYEEQLVQIVQDEEVDWFIPVSHINKALPDTRAKMMMQTKRKVSDLGITDPIIASQLDDKVQFLSLAEKMGLSVPEFHSFSGRYLSTFYFLFFLCFTWPV